MVPARFDQLAGQSFHAEISTEQPDLLDQNDVVGWITIPGTPPPVSSSSPATRPCGSAGRAAWWSSPGSRGALSFSSVLSMPVLLDHRPGEFAAHMGG
jgi:iron complex transport system substrate-binding protein